MRRLKNTLLVLFALACGATVFEGDVERIKHDTAPAGAGGEVVVVRVCGVSQSNSGGQGQVAEELSAVEVVAGAGMCVSLSGSTEGGEEGEGWGRQFVVANDVMYASA